MTDDMLRLAMAVYPNAEVLDGDIGYWDSVNCWNDFDPANNADQAWDVLAWLTQRGVIGEGILTDTEDGPLFKNDGTASGIRAAVVEAARRVVK